MIGEPEVVDGRTARLFGTFQDMTEQREQELKMRHLALTDALTGIANRAAFNEKLDEVAEKAARSGRSFLLCVIDLNRFKQVNDVHGHAAGDAVLALSDAEPWLSALGHVLPGTGLGTPLDLSATIGRAGTQWQFDELEGAVAGTGMATLILGALIALLTAPMMANRIERMVMSAPFLGLSEEGPPPGFLSVAAGATAGMVISRAATTPRTPVFIGSVPKRKIPAPPGNRGIGRAGQRSLLRALAVLAKPRL